MTALNNMKSALLDAKTEAASLRIRVRQLEEKLVEVAAAGELTADRLRDEVKQLRTSSGLWSGRVQELLEENGRLRDERDKADGTVASMTIQITDLRGMLAEEEAKNTPLKEALRRIVESVTHALCPHCRVAQAVERGKPETGPWFRKHARGRGACEGSEQPLREAFVVTGTTSDNTSMRQPEPLAHPFIPAPFYENKCDAILDVQGRQRTCARPRAEHGDER